MTKNLEFLSGLNLQISVNQYLQNRKSNYGQENVFNFHLS